MYKHYYCPYCGESQLKTNVICVKCHSIMKLAESKYDSEFYRNKSFENYGDYSHWYEYLLEEIKDNPLFNEEKFNYISSENEQEKILDDIFDKTKQENNMPKCPTCGSTNIENISGANRAVHAYAFGLFSKTARSQFHCKNCGYKW